MGLPRRFGPLGERPFRLLWIGQATSAVGATLWIAAAVVVAANVGALAVPSVRNLRRRAHERTPVRLPPRIASLQPAAAE
jgi:hypothetical protein